MAYVDHVVQEILETERTYVKDLQSIVQVGQCCLCVCACIFACVKQSAHIQVMTHRKDKLLFLYSPLLFLFQK